VSIVAAVVTRLEAVSAVTALVSTRIYNGTFPQDGTFPAIRVQRIGQDEQMHMRGAVGTMRTRIQIDSVADSSEPIGDAQAIDSAVFGNGSGSALIGWAGDVGTIDIQAVTPAGVREQYDGEELRQYRVMRDAFVWWNA
jgi:hypothetical protein